MRDIGRRISLEDVVDQLPIGVFLTDPDGNCLAVNRHWCRYAGMTPEAAAGQGWVEAIHPRDRDRVSAAWNRAVKAGRRFELEYRFRSPTGRVVWLHASASTVIDSRDRLAGYVGSVVEITRLRKAESRIERSEREAKRANTLLADLLDVIPSAISLYDSDMRMVLCNAAYHDLYPQQREIAVAGSRVEDIIRYGLERGLYPPARGREETWLRERLDYQRNLSEDVSERLIHSRRGWLQIRERRTADGGSVSIRTDVTQIKDAQEALSEQAAILEAASHHMDQGFLMLDANLRVVAHNARMAALLGVAEPVLRNKPDYEQVLRAQTVAGELLNPSGDPDALIFSSLRDLTVAEGAFSVERRRPNGAVIELRCSPLPDSGWVLTGIDVTRRKRTEEDLRRNLDAMGRLYAVTSSPDIAFEDKVSRLLALGSEIFGLPLGIVSRVTGQTYRIEYVHGPADAPRAGAAFDLHHLLRPCVRRRRAARIRSRRAVLLAGSPLLPDLSSGGLSGDSDPGRRSMVRNPELFLAFGAQPAVQRGRLLADSPHGPVDRRRNSPQSSPGSPGRERGAVPRHRLDGSPRRQHRRIPDGTLLYSNEQTLALFRIPRSLVGKLSARKLYADPADRDAIIAELEERREIVSREILMRRLDDEEFWALISARIITFDNQRALIVAILDLTERKKIEDMKNVFVSTVSHELRTPLTAISGSLGLLGGGGGGPLPTQARNLVEVAHRNSKRLIELVNDILDMEKIRSGRMTFRFERVDMNDLILGAVEANAPYAEQFGVTLKVRTCRGDARVRGDPDRLTQVLTNLLSNAAKFSPGNGIVTLTVACERDLVRVRVVDKGEGIPEAFRPRLFEPFAQAETSDSTRVPRPGLV